MQLIQTKRTALSYGINDSATTIRLENLLKLDGTSISASDLDTYLVGTFAPGTSREEIFSINGSNVTINTDGTVDVTGVIRGLKEVYPYGTGGFTSDHSAGEIVVFGDNPQVFQWLKDYIDSAVVTGAVPASDTVPGIVIEATQAQIDAGTETESYGGQDYDLILTPDKVRAKKYHDYVADAGANDSYAITVVPAITAYAVGQEFTFKANTANTGACTLNVCGLGAKTIKKDVTTDLITGDILAGQTVKVSYDGTNMQMVSQLGNSRDVSLSSGILPIAKGGTGSSIYAFKNGSTTYDVSTASGTQTIAHGLGRIPFRVRIKADLRSGSASGIATLSIAETVYNGTTQSSNSLLSQNAYNSSGYTTNDSDSFILWYQNLTDTVTGVVTFDATNIYIAWTKVNSPTGTAKLLWEAQ
jgi:hypothetical protein